jgi:hypothetical protein
MYDDYYNNLKKNLAKRMLLGEVVMAMVLLFG